MGDDGSLLAGPIIDDSSGKVKVTDRLAANRQNKFERIWNELLEKIAELNQVIHFHRQDHRLFDSFHR